MAVLAPVPRTARWARHGHALFEGRLRDNYRIRACVDPSAMADPKAGGERFFSVVRDIIIH